MSKKIVLATGGNALSDEPAGQMKAVKLLLRQLLI